MSPDRPEAAGPADRGGRIFLECGERLLELTDPLAVELTVAGLLAQPREQGGSPAVADDAVRVALAEVVARPGPAAAAVLRAVLAVGSTAQRTAARGGLSAISAAGEYPPWAWGQVVGRPSVGQAFRRYDVFGDGELIAVTFGYGGREHLREHAVVARIDLCRPAVVTEVYVETDVAALLDAVRDDSDPLQRWEELDPAVARARFEPALARCDSTPPSVPRDCLPALLVAQARLRRLPRGDGTAASAAASEDAGEPEEAGLRDRLVDAFVAEHRDQVRDADDLPADVLRFWGNVLAGSSAMFPGVSPTLVGPVRLARLLLGYVPSMFELTPAQRRGLAPSVAAWARWAGRREHLDDAALERLTADLAVVFDAFDASYAEPRHVAQRRLIGDVAAETADASLLATALARRSVAVPAPSSAAGEPDATEAEADLRDPAVRRHRIELAHTGCAVPDGLSQAEFLDAATRVCEQVWHDAPPEVWQRMLGLLAAGMSPHDAVHRLVESTVTAA